MGTKWVENNRFSIYFSIYMGKKERFFEIYDIYPATNQEKALNNEIAERLCTEQVFMQL